MSRPPLESNPLRGLRFKKHADLHSKKTGNPISIPGRNSQPPTTSRIDLTDDVDDVPALSNATNSSSTPATYQPSNSSFPPSSSRSSGRLHTRRAMYHANLHPTSNLQNKPKPKRLRRSCQNLPLNVIFASKKSSAPSQPTFTRFLYPKPAHTPSRPPQHRHPVLLCAAVQSHPALSPQPQA